MHLMLPALPQEPADGVAGRAADLVDPLGGPGCPAVRVRNRNQAQQRRSS
ncbi:hypothetical protein SAMN06272789_1403 [Streptomyces sp. 1331.2]|nr:hypothetical protein SAMN06272789_1403 [Streptomyces sp. 1331.2]